MNVAGVLFLGFRHLARHRGKAALLIAAITISLVLPLGVSLFVKQAETHLRARANATPALLGAVGSPMELVFGGLYFSNPDLATFQTQEVRNLTSDGLATAIPIDARFHARGNPIVGTTLDYFFFRNLTIAEGRHFGRIGDCVLGADVARELQLAPGDTIVSSPVQLFDLAGVYPLKMRITGILAPAGTPDDEAIFVDTRTVWILDGTSHGHVEVDEASEAEILETDVESGTVSLNASVQQFNEVTDENVDSFHPHGDPDTFPLTAAIVLPKDRKSETILMGRFEASGLPTQLIRPTEVMDNLFATVFQIRNLVILALVAVGVCAGLIACVVFLLSNRLRAREFESLTNLGASRSTVRALIFFEAAFVILASFALTVLILTALHFVTPSLIGLLQSR